MSHSDTWGGERAVSPVIGGVLLVAIVVILAAVLGAFATGLGTAEPAPHAQFTFEILEKSGQPDELVVTHETGDSVPNTELYFVIEGEDVQDEEGSPSGGKLSWYAVAEDGGEETTTMTRGESVSMGDKATIEVAGGGQPELEDKVVYLVWQGQGNSATIDVWRGPDAPST